MTDFTQGIEADYWDSDPSAESFTHRTLAAAVDFYVDEQCGAPREDDAEFLECLRVLAPRTFFAWRRVTVDQTTVNAIAVLLADITVGSELEEFVDPNRLRLCDKVLQKRLEVAFVDVLGEHLLNSSWQPWHCEQIGQVTLTAVQMEALLRESCQQESEVGGMRWTTMKS